MDCPAYAVVAKLTRIQVWVLLLSLKIDASVWPEVSLICPSTQSKVQSGPEHSESAVCVQYQKLSWLVPMGTVTVWVSVLSPSVSGAGWTGPSNAEWVPLWA